MDFNDIHHQSFSVFKITEAAHFDFSPEMYSQFKFGSIKAARFFGKQLAEKYIIELKSNYKGDQLVVIPSAYSHIPTASYYMAQSFRNYLNHFLYTEGYPILEETKIHRTVSYREDYGAMTAEERFRLISGDQFHVDKAFLKDKRLIFIDDIKITGTHERIVCKMLTDLQINNFCDFLYFAELADVNIHPNIENLLNHYSVQHLDHVEALIVNNDFVMNTRVVKFILNSAIPDFQAFIARQSVEFNTALYFNAIGNTYYQFEAYRANLDFLLTQLHLN